VSDHAAQIAAAGGRRAVLFSSLPLVGRTLAGASAPIDLALQSVDGGFAPASSASQVLLPSLASGEVRFVDQGFGLRLQGAVAQPGALTNDRVFYGDVYGQSAGVDALLQAKQTGAEISYVIRSASSPEDQSIRFDLPAGARLVLEGASGGPQAVKIEAADGRLLGLVFPPAAVDAVGNPVRSSYSVSSPDTLVMHVAHREGSYEYPILADPLVASWDPGMYASWAWTTSMPGYFGGINSSGYTATTGPGAVGQGAYGWYAYWYYGSLAGAYIYEHYAYSVWHYPNNSEEYGGIVNSGFTAWENGTWQDTVPSGGSGPGGSGSPASRFQAAQESYVNTTYCAGGSAADCVPPAHGTIAAPNDVETAGVFLLAASTNGFVPEAATYGDYLYESDDQVPSVSGSLSGFGSGWQQTQSGSVPVSGSVSTGLGMRYVQLLENGYAQDTSYASSSGYPYPFSQSATFSPYIYLGTNTFTAQAADQGGNTASTGTLGTVCADGVAPATSESGTLWNAPENVVLPGTNTLDVSATDGIADGQAYDQQSGVKSITTTISGPNGVEPGFPKTTGATGGTTVTCLGGSTPADASGSQTDTVDTTNWTPGQYTITVSVPDNVGNVTTNSKTVDVVGEANAVSTVQGVVDGVVNAPPAGQYSNTCTSPGATIADGYAGGSTYVTLRAQPNPSDSTQEWVCYRVSNPDSGSVGGRVTVGGVSASGGLPSSDGSAGACQANQATNQVPGPHPLINGSVLSQSVMVDTYQGSAAPGQVWVCLTAGSQNDRVIVPVPSAGGTPTVYNQFDVTPPPLPSPAADPYPSGTCQNATTGTTTQLVNGSVSGEQVWLYEWQSPDGQTVDLCARAAGAAMSGGVLSVSTAGSPGVSPVVGPGSSSACTFSIFQIVTPPQAASSLSTSPIGPPPANPATVCVGVGTSAYAYQVGATGGPVAPTVTWTPDPGTP